MLDGWRPNSNTRTFIRIPSPRCVYVYNHAVVYRVGVYHVDYYIVIIVFKLDENSRESPGVAVVGSSADMVRSDI